MLETKHHWLPIALAIFLPVSFIITYSIAVANGHVQAAFPYISDTGTHPPESCVFGQLMNIGAFTALCIVYIRYRHVTILYGDQPSMKNVIRFNMAAFVLGIVITMGVSIVGNFQETNVIVVHLIGAFMAFGVGFFYILLQTIIAYKTARATILMPGNTARLLKFRVFLCLLDFIFLIIMTATSLTSAQKGSKDPDLNFLKWTSSNPGYAEHVTATASEWIVAIISVVYFGTFYLEFRHFRVKSPVIDFYESPTTENTEDPKVVSSAT